MFALLAALTILTLWTRPLSSASRWAELNQKLDRMNARLDAISHIPPAHVTHRTTRQTTASPTAMEPASPAPQSAPADGRPDLIHVMGPGETLWNVAEQFYGDPEAMSALMKYNHVVDARVLTVGTSIKIPCRAKLHLSPLNSHPPSHNAPLPTPH